MERSDRGESHKLFLKTGVPLWFSVSLLCGNTKVSSSEPVGAQRSAARFRLGFLTQKKTCIHITSNILYVGVVQVYIHFEDAPKLLALVLESEAGVHGQEPVVLLCFFRHSRPT